MFNLELINHGNKIEETISVENFVSKPIESLRYAKYIDDRSIAIEYIESEEVNSKDNLEILDTSWLVPNNNTNFLSEVEEVELGNGSFFSNFKEVVITNIVGYDVNNYEVPIFFKHKTKLKEANVYCLKNGDNFEIESGFLFQDNCIYTNYNNYFEEETGKYIMYFVSGIDLEGNSVNELLNLVPVIREATWEDIDIESGELDPNVYTRDREGNGFLYRITQDNSNCSDQEDYISQQYFVKNISRNLISLVKPEEYNLNNDWVLRVTNGQVFQNGLLYKIAEYGNQPFNPIYGTLYFRNKTCFRINSNLVKLPVQEIRVNPENYMHLNVHIHDSENNLIKAVTTNSDLVGKEKETGITYEEGIVSWDEYAGVVELDFTTLSTQIITADFYYYADTFLIRELNFNPFFNEKLVYNSYYFYVKPFQDGLTRSLHWLLLDEDDRIVECSEDTLKLEQQNVFNPNTIIGKTLKTFREEYCFNYENDFQNMELGRVFLKEDFYVDEIHNFSVRERTYTKEATYKEMLLRQWKVLQSKFGYGELGQIVQKNNILYIEAPYSLLSEFTEEEVERNIKVNLPLNLDIVIEYIYPKSKLSFDVSNAGQVDLSISWEAQGTYKVYRNSIETINSEIAPIYTIDSLEEEALLYTDNDVESGNRYYYWVQINDNPYSDPFGVKVR